MVVSSLGKILHPHTVQRLLPLECDFQDVQKMQEGGRHEQLVGDQAQYLLDLLFQHQDGLW